MNIRVQLKGSRAMIARLQQIGSREHRRAEEAMEDGGGLMLDYSGTLVPYDTGALHDSTANRQVENSKRRIRQTIGYGAPQASVNPKSGIHPGEYAVEQHEVPYQHQNGRTWKYLEFALYRKAADFVELLRRRLKL